MSVDHYENFPVASLLLPARLREPVRAIYAFARSADDIADEGALDPAERLAGLARYREELEAIAADFAELMDYCRRSANPVGRLLLHLFGRDDAKSQSLSDAVCSSLQLINHWQDIAIDWGKGRVYLPQDELARFGIGEAQIAEGRWDAAWAAMMDFQIERARRMLRCGSPLVHILPGRIGLELRLIIASGLRVLDKLARVRGDVFRRRPVIGKRDWPAILLRAALG